MKNTATFSRLRRSLRWNHQIISSCALLPCVFIIDTWDAFPKCLYQMNVPCVSSGHPKNRNTWNKKNTSAATRQQNKFVQRRKQAECNANRFPLPPSICAKKSKNQVHFPRLFQVEAEASERVSKHKEETKISWHLGQSEKHLQVLEVTFEMYFCFLPSFPHMYVYTCVFLWVYWSTSPKLEKSPVWASRDSIFAIQNWRSVYMIWQRHPRNLKSSKKKQTTDHCFHLAHFGPQKRTKTFRSSSADEVGQMLYRATCGWKCR